MRTFVAIRHAAPESEGYADETLRPLSGEGRRKQHLITGKLQDLEITPAMIFSSPILRARQTADLLSEKFGAPVEETDALGYIFNGKELLELLSSASDGTVFYFVGHAPHLGEFVNQLTGKSSLPEGLSKSAAAVIRFEEAVVEGKGNLVSHLEP